MRGCSEEGIEVLRGNWRLRWWWSALGSWVKNRGQRGWRQADKLIAPQKHTDFTLRLTAS